VPLNDRDAVLVSAARTPIGRAHKGSLIGVRPDDLAVAALRGALERSGARADLALDDLILGCAEPRGEQGQNAARRIALLLGRDDLPGTSVNRFCASSLQGLRMALHAIRADEGDAFLVAGTESVSRTPADPPQVHPDFAPAQKRAATQLAGEGWEDPRSTGHLPDYYAAMGATAEFVARATGTSRADQDAFAAESQRRAAAAQQSGYFAEEIVSVVTPDGAIVDADDSPRPGTTAEKLGGLNPVFAEHGTVTAGNACPLNDGASALLVMSAGRARAEGLEPAARIIGTTVTALSPEIMGLGPVEATGRLLDRHGLTAADLDVVELNEAFAAQAVPVIRQLGLDPEKVNPHGGAIALGHPFGATGARLVQTLAHGLTARDGHLGVATLCIGGGQGMAMLLERLS
jgi:acetyl-CoA C-acetyltransferase